MCLSFILVWIFVDIKLPYKPQTLREKLARIDWLGSLTLVLGVGSLLVAVTLKGSEELPWGNPMSWGLLVTSGVFICAFFGVEAFVSKEPIMPLRLLRQRTPLAVSASNL